MTSFSLAADATLPQFSDTTQWAQIGAATISIYATNTSSITATNMNTSSRWNCIVLAFNTLGWQSENFLFNALDAILGSPDIDEGFGTSPLADVSAYSLNSTLDATTGSISVDATEEATITATTGNEFLLARLRTDRREQQFLRRPDRDQHGQCAGHRLYQLDFECAGRDCRRRLAVGHRQRRRRDQRHQRSADFVDLGQLAAGPAFELSQ